MHPEVHSAIVGIRTVEQLDGIERAAELDLSPEVMARLDDIFILIMADRCKKASYRKLIPGKTAYIPTPATRWRQGHDIAGVEQLSNSPRSELRWYCSC